jgi:adenine phosphoribosyltransferase
MILDTKIKSAMIDVHDFPKPGIIYKDITPIFQNSELSSEILDELVKVYANTGIEAVVGLESRGFLFAMPLAMRLGVPFVMVRKKGKLPRECYSVSYSLEYGQSEIEMHRDALHAGQKVLIHDDVLATGGTAAAAAQLVEKAGAEVAAFSFLVELSFLKGSEKLSAFTQRITTFARF